MPTLYSGTTLYAIAAAEYGDATQWWRIARANGLTETDIQAPTSLIIPPGTPPGSAQLPDE